MPALLLALLAQVPACPVIGAEDFAAAQKLGEVQAVFAAKRCGIGSVGWAGLQGMLELEAIQRDLAPIVVLAPEGWGYLFGPVSRTTYECLCSSREETEITHFSVGDQIGTLVAEARTLYTSTADAPEMIKVGHEAMVKRFGKMVSRRATKRSVENVRPEKRGNDYSCPALVETWVTPELTIYLTASRFGKGCGLGAVQVAYLKKAQIEALKASEADVQEAARLTRVREEAMAAQAADADRRLKGL